MTQDCPHCGLNFDDYEQSTICPHQRLRSQAMQEQWEAAMHLLGNKVRFNHWESGTGRHCHGVTYDGMLHIEGMTGEFAPHLFVIDGETTSIPLLGKVQA